MLVHGCTHHYLAVGLAYALAVSTLSGCYASRVPGDGSTDGGVSAHDAAGDTGRDTDGGAPADASVDGPDLGAACPAPGVYRAFARVETSDPVGCTESTGQPQGAFVDIAFPFEPASLEGCQRGSRSDSVQTGPCEWTLTFDCGSPLPGLARGSVSVLGFADGVLHGHVEHRFDGDLNGCAWTVRIVDEP
jgi:hypothetical protein